MKAKLLLSSFAIAASALPLATAARSAPAQDPRAQEIVSYADLDLNSPAERARLEWRLESAASRLCAEDDHAMPVAETDERCFGAAMTDAHRQLGQALAQKSKAVLGAALQIVIMRP